MNKKWSILVLLIIIISFFAVSAFADDAPEVRRWFPESGYWVEGAFLTYYESIPSAELIFGYPLSEKLVDPLTGIEIQYFERARFENDPAKFAGDTVQLTNLGTLLYTKGSAHQLKYSITACSAYLAPDSNQYQVCYSFLTFYEEQNGERLFGKPISNLEFSDERIVQYFEKAKLEWHPELPPGNRIVISNLGEQYLADRGGGDPLAENVSPVKSILSLNVNAFVENPVSANGEDQSVHIIVQNQNGEPVNQVQLNLIITYPSGEMVSRILDPTDDLGYSSYDFKVNSEQHGITSIQIEASDNIHTTYTRTSFRIWW